MTLNYATKDDLEHLIILPSPLLCWHYRCRLPYLAYVVCALLDIKPKALCVLGKHSTNRATSPAYHVEMFKEQTSSTYGH